jgi:hypothetical protein
MKAKNSLKKGQSSKKAGPSMNKMAAKGGIPPVNIAGMDTLGSMPIGGGAVGKNSKKGTKGQTSAKAGVKKKKGK